MSIRYPYSASADARELAARLRQRVTFQQALETDDGAGGQTLSWTDVATLWAEIIPYRMGLSSERMLGEQFQSEVTHRITIRYRDDITADMRISYGGRYFNIRSVVNVAEANTLLEILAEEGVAV